MKVKFGIYILVAVVLVSSCMHKDSVPEDIVVPAFVDVRYDFGSFLDRGYVVLSATLNTKIGITDAGFVVGLNEASMTYRKVDFVDNIIALRLDAVDFDTEYCFYAKASNDVNEIRTKLIRLRTPKELEDFKPQEPEHPDDPGKPDEPDPPVVTPPEGVGITVSDDNFLAYLLTVCDKDKDGSISVEEAATVREMSFCTDEMWTLDGIQYFTALSSLSCDGSVWNGGLTSLSLGNNTKLKILSCSFNALTSLVLPSSLEELYMRFNNVTRPNFKGLSNLKKLDCFCNYMTELDLSSLVRLEELTCGMNVFTTLDVSNNLNLNYLDLSDSPKLEIVYMARGQRIDTIIADNRIQFKYKE